LLISQQVFINTQQSAVFVLWPRAVTNLHFFRAPAALSSRNRLISAECWCTLTARALLLHCYAVLLSVRECIIFHHDGLGCVCTHSLSLSHTKRSQCQRWSCFWESRDRQRSLAPESVYIYVCAACDSLRWERALCLCHGPPQLAERKDFSQQQMNSFVTICAKRTRPACSFTKLRSTEKSKMVFVSNVSALDA
jgi:hypothetical protein